VPKPIAAPSAPHEPELRILRWSLAATAAALWLAIAWRDAWLLVLVPLVAACSAAWLARRRRTSTSEDAADDVGLL
jgi:hypothetical protein